MCFMPSSATRSRASCARSGPAASGISTAPRCPRSRWCAACCRAPRCISCTRSKSRPAIHAAFREYGVTDFALDSKDELEKILQETVRAELVGTPPVLGLFVRLAVGQGGAYDLSGKFGVAVEEAAELLRLARPHAARLGLCFHVGSQCLDPAAYARAMALAADAVALSGVAIDIVDVGGGFPVSYPDVVPPPLDDYVAAIGEAAARVRRRRQAVGRAGAGAGGGRRVGGRAGAAAPRRRAVRQ